MVWCGTLWYIVVWCGTLWYGVVHCGTLWYIAVHCGTLWYIVVHCGTLWYIVVHCGTLWYIAVHCGTLWYIAVHCGTLWYIVVWCARQNHRRTGKYFITLPTVSFGSSLTIQCSVESVGPDWAIYWTLGNFLKPWATINLPKSPSFLGNFCKGVKIYHFFSEIIFG